MARNDKVIRAEIEKVLADIKAIVDRLREEDREALLKAFKRLAALYVELFNVDVLQRILLTWVIPWRPRARGKRRRR